MKINNYQNEPLDAPYVIIPMHAREIGRYAILINHLGFVNYYKRRLLRLDFKSCDKSKANSIIDRT